VLEIILKPLFANVANVDIRKCYRNILDFLLFNRKTLKSFLLFEGIYSGVIHGVYLRLLLYWCFLESTLAKHLP
jgi:hypothetical protein